VTWRETIVARHVVAFPVSADRRLLYTKAGLVGRKGTGHATNGPWHPPELKKLCPLDAGSFVVLLKPSNQINHH
jgi:hypothetical protein